jgi:hypothetical protein
MLSLESRTLPRRNTEGGTQFHLGELQSGLNSIKYSEGKNREGSVSLLQIPHEKTMSRILFSGLLLVGALALGQHASQRPADSPALCLANYHEFKPAAIKVALPDVQQPDEYSCGTASLMAILAYYGPDPRITTFSRRNSASRKRTALTITG